MRSLFFRSDLKQLSTILCNIISPFKDNFFLGGCIYGWLWGYRHPQSSGLGIWKALIPFGQHGMTLDEEMQMMKLKGKAWHGLQGWYGKIGWSMELKTHVFQKYWNLNNVFLELQIGWVQMDVNGTFGDSESMRGVSAWWRSYCRGRCFGRWPLVFELSNRWWPYEDTSIIPLLIVLSWLGSLLFCMGRLQAFTGSATMLWSVV